ncbi:unnamed protein product [Caenorhabditis auriculariae]|uniref:Unconventional myosin-VI n=1 Tax=Caenorhabditis auriculariae TaxID=2777116 RepID=A0A8S1H676_9PELO|nr:unnamed protein product [Caenorhabditis auriculariae]
MLSSLEKRHQMGSKAAEAILKPQSQPSRRSLPKTAPPVEKKREINVRIYPSKMTNNNNDGTDFGRLVWVTDPNEGFVLARIQDISHEGLTLQLERTGDQIKRKYDEVFASEEDLAKSVEDNCGLMYLNEATLLNNCRIRYAQNKIYTYVANILISINPYQAINGFYTPEKIHEYRGKSLGQMEPHIFAIADKAYREMRRYKQSQSIIVSGESGAGKTESQKAVLRYLCENWGAQAGPIQQRILETNPILEAFGNAKTLRNNNSSRFGKFVQIHFDNDGQVAGGFVSHYLLETSRVCRQAEGERNYHIFYQLIAGAPDDLYKKLHLAPASKFNYLSGSCQMFAHPGAKIEVPSERIAVQEFARDTMVDDFSDYRRLAAALKGAGLDEKQQIFIWATIAGLLHLGNVTFEESVGDSKGGCRVQPQAEESVHKAAELLGIEPAELKMGLVARIMQATKGGVKGTLIRVPLKAHEAAAGRDALAKAIYSKLFDWLVACVNKSIPFEASAQFIGVLDIAGFEFFAVNSFEQFCINFCNEKLQHFFNERILKQEQELYKTEGLNVPVIEYTDNQDCIELFEKKGTGLFDLLDEEAKLPRPTPQHFAQAVHTAHKGHFRLDTPRKSKLRLHRDMRDEEGFMVRHYAGTVCYQTQQFLEKNNDQLHNSLEILIEQSAVDLLRQLFEQTAAPAAQVKRTGGRLQAASVGGKFKSQLVALLEKLQSTGTHFVRCIKPNNEMKPWTFDGAAILTQLQCAGMTSVLRLMQKGFPSRTPFAELYSTYQQILPPNLARLDPRLFCKCLFRALGLNSQDYQFGMTKVFFRPGKFAEFDQMLRQDPATMKDLVSKVRIWLVRARWRKAQYGAWSVIKLKNKIAFRAAQIRRIQSAVRGFLVRKKYQKRIRVYRNSLQLLSRTREMIEIIDKMQESSQEKWSKTVQGTTQELESLVDKIKRSDLDEQIERAVQCYEMCVSHVDKLILELKQQLESDELAEVERKRQEQLALEAREREDRERAEQEKIARKKMEEEREKAQKEYECRLAEQQQMEQRERQLEEERRKKEERERLDAAVSTRIATADGVQLAADAPSTSVSTENSTSSKPKGKYDLSNWKYADLRDTINNSNGWFFFYNSHIRHIVSDVELLLACKEEFHRRLRIYNQWKSDNTASRDLPPSRAPLAVYNESSTIRNNMAPHMNPALTLQRYFKVPFNSKTESTKNPGKMELSGAPSGIWFAHFNGQWIQRQISVKPGSKPALLIAGKDDLLMCELPLDQTGLQRRKGAEISATDFETIWAHYGGKPLPKNFRVVLMGDSRWKVPYRATKACEIASLMRKPCFSTDSRGWSFVGGTTRSELLAQTLSLCCNSAQLIVLIMAAEFQQTYCIDFNGWVSGTSTAPPPKQIDFNSQTIPQLIYTKASSDRVAAVFEAEKQSMTFAKIVTEMESLASGLLSTGLNPGDRILVCGSNHSQVVICALACARAGLVFSLVNPNFPNSQTLHRALVAGDFRCIICFRAHQFEADYLNSLLLEIAPELMASRKGDLKSAKLPKLTHVVLAEEDHRHAGTFTLSEIFLKSNKEKVAKLPNYENWSSHKLACLQFTLGSSGHPKLVALSHYQMLNGARAVVTAFGIQKEHVLACALPVFRIAIFNLVCLAPFLTECRSVFPEPSPLPRNLFSCVSKYKCSTLLTNGAALRLLLKISQTQRVKLSALESVLLIGDRVSKEVLRLIELQAENVKIVAVGYLLTETGSIPIMGDQKTDFTRNVGRPIAGYETHLIPLDGSEGKIAPGGLGKLLMRVYYGSTFMGYAPDTSGKDKWVDTGDVARMDVDGNIEIVTHSADLIFDKNNCLLEHWNVERLLNQSELLKGVQVVSTGRGQPMTAVCVPRSTQNQVAYLKDELRAMCRDHRFPEPEAFAFVEDFPRVHTKIQKYRIREMLESGQISVF